MSRKDELLKIAKVLRAQAEGRGPAKRYLRKLADDYEHEADRLSRNSPNKHKHNSAA
jgi:hypothetical protein